MTETDTICIVSTSMRHHRIVYPIYLSSHQSFRKRSNRNITRGIRFFTIDALRQSRFFAMNDTTKMIYFDLVLSADQDGFYDIVATTLRQSRTKSSTISALSENGFIICFTKNLIVITNWFQMNKTPRRNTRKRGIKRKKRN